MRKPIQIVLLIVLMLAVAAGSFYGGMVYGKQQVAGATLAAGFPPDGQAFPIAGQDGALGVQRGQGAGNQFRGATEQPGVAFGQIEAIDGNTLTIHDRNDNPIKVEVADTTLIEKSASVSVSDLAVGDTVIVSGNPNDDGGITARSVQVAPAGRFFGGNPGSPPSGDAQDGQSQ